MKKIIFVCIFIIVTLCFFMINVDKNNLKVLENSSRISKETNPISMMLETEYKSGVYEVSSENEWPTEGYIFNETLSKCENGSALTWDSDKNIVLLNGVTKDRCYVYFDSLVEFVHFTIDSVEFRAEKGMTWRDFSFSQYNTANIYALNGGIYYDNSWINYGFSYLLSNDEIINESYCAKVIDCWLSSSGDPIKGVMPSFGISGVFYETGDVCQSCFIQIGEDDNTFAFYYLDFVRENNSYFAFFPEELNQDILDIYGKSAYENAMVDYIFPLECEEYQDPSDLIIDFYLSTAYDSDTQGFVIAYFENENDSNEAYLLNVEFGDNLIVHVPGNLFDSEYNLYFLLYTY